MRFLLLAFAYSLSFTSLACTGGTNAGTLTPTGAYQTQAVSVGQYYVVNVVCGSTYNFTFCSNGGTAGWDTQITINQTDNTTQLAYNDDACGLQSNVSWTATFTGTVHVLISLYNCNNGAADTGTMAYNVTSTSVSYNASCTSANPTISGAGGGTFAFNPAPGDGAAINPATGVITNATEGASYSVDYTYCGGTINVPLTMGTAPCFSLNGNAQYITVGGESCIQLTAEVNDQTGCAWNGSLIDFNSSFTLTLDYYFGNNINGADGNTFTFQPSSSTACGQAGGQLGAGGLTNALSIEFDTYDNDNPAHIFDISCDHIAVEIDGNMLGPGAPYAGPVCAKAGGANIDDGGTYPVDIEWNSATQQLDIYFNGVLRLSTSGDFVNTVFGGQNLVYWGATSATGGLNNQQYFCPSSVVVLPVELASFESACGVNEVNLNWTTVSENRLDYFIVEYTYDGIVFENYGVVDAGGNTTELHNYSISISKETVARYYRLKMVDDDGTIRYSGIISDNQCASNGIIGNIIESTDEISITLSATAHLQLINSAGQLLTSMEVESGDTFSLQKGQMASGIYILNVIDTNGKSESRKLFVH